jgi:hypothetical protein
MMFHAIFTTTLRKFGWTTKIPNISPLIVKYTLGLYHFAQVQARPVSPIQSACRAWPYTVMIRQEDLEEDKCRRERKITELYHFGLYGTYIP